MDPFRPFIDAHPVVKNIISTFESKIGLHSKFIKSLPEGNPHDIFANGEISFGHLETFGFDYDYTLASYTNRVQEFIYYRAANWLVDEQRYPNELKTFKYDSKFAIRGLSFDIEKGNLLKLDYLGHLLPDNVYRGRRKLSLDECLDAYPSLFITRKQTLERMRALSDIYSLAEASLISDVIDYFTNNNISFDPSYVFDDVMRAIKHVHSGVIHRDIVDNLPLYLNKEPDLIQFLLKLRRSKKKTFLLTN
jgi:HAD superfamily 5'-nucleotidase-like hydrolase